MKVSIILGTRPEIIKISPIVRECERLGVDFFILHTEQHYFHNMNGIFFEQLNLPSPKYNLDVGSGSHAEQTGRMLIGIEKVLKKEEPDVVLVEGDTNTVLAGALAASKLEIRVGHVEAGLRSYDRRMPEETNRVLADHCSDYLFAPTKKAKKILLSEGLPEDRIFVTGNTIVDAVYQNLKLANNKGNALAEFGLRPKGYFLVTTHRQENVDDEDRFAGILKGLELVGNHFCAPVIYPIHPRAVKMMEIFGLEANGVKLIEPVDFLTFLQLEGNARIVLTDSGGVQEETCILGVPCVTLRDNTERPESLEAGSNMLAGTNPGEILRCAQKMVLRDNGWENPFGDGNAGKRIVKILREKHE